MRGLRCWVWPSWWLDAAMTGASECLTIDIYRVSASVDEQQRPSGVRRNAGAYKSGRKEVLRTCGSRDRYATANDAVQRKNFGNFAQNSKNAHARLRHLACEVPNAWSRKKSSKFAEAKKLRCLQDFRSRGFEPARVTPMDFKSIALTTRPRHLLDRIVICQCIKNDSITQSARISAFFRPAPAQDIPQEDLVRDFGAHVSLTRRPEPARGACALARMVRAPPPLHPAPPHALSPSWSTTVVRWWPW